jgi:hypothetical protein
MLIPLRGVARVATPIALASLLQLGCSSASTGASGEAAGTSEAHLFGPIINDDCGADTYLRQSINVGRFVAMTPEFVQCINDNYIACHEDDLWMRGALVAKTEADNATRISCPGLSGVTLGHTEWSDQHDPFYRGTETIALDHTWLDRNATRAPMPDGSTNPWGWFEVASVVWHEAMHVYGYSHGDNDDADDAAEDCGFGGDPNWFWKRQAAPYTVQMCMTGAYGYGGSIVPGRSDPPFELSTSMRSSIVDRRFAAHYKPLTDAHRASIFARIAAGGYTTDDLDREAIGNGSPANPTWIGINGEVVSDILSGDASYFAFKLDRPAMVRVQATRADHSAAATPMFALEGALLSQPVLSPSSTESTLYGVDMTRLLPAGSYLVHLYASPASMAIDVKVDEVLPPPPSCTYDVYCGSTLEATCGSAPVQAVIQYSADRGATWTTWNGLYPLSADIPTDASGRSDLMRVCYRATTTDAVSCASVIDPDAQVHVCPTTGGGGGGGGSGKGKVCKGRFCTTG